VLAVVGDLLGTRIGKARLSLLGMRPRRTAMTFTAITGSLIAGLSFTTLIATNVRWRRGLFELGHIEQSLWNTREDLNKTQQTLEATQEFLVASHEALVKAAGQRSSAEVEIQQLKEQSDGLHGQVQDLQQTINYLDSQRQHLLNQQGRLTEEVRLRDQELAQLQRETDSQIAALDSLRRRVTALRRGDVAIASDEPLVMAKVKLPHSDEPLVAIESLLNRANQVAHERLLPGQRPTRRLIRILTSEVERIAEDLQNGDAHLVIIRSANNVLQGETTLLVFADVRPNLQVLEEGQVLASTVVVADERSMEDVNQRLNLLLGRARSRASQLGAVNTQVVFDNGAIADLIQRLVERTDSYAILDIFSLEDSETGDPLHLGVRWRKPSLNGDSPGEPPEDDQG